MLDLEAYEIEFKPVSPEAAIERALRWSALIAEHPPPEGVNAITRIVWAALLDVGGPMTTQDLATMFQRHRGSIDRALIPLRRAGLSPTSTPPTLRSSVSGTGIAVRRGRRWWCSG